MNRGAAYWLNLFYRKRWQFVKVQVFLQASAGTIT